MKKAYNFNKEDKDMLQGIYFYKTLILKNLKNL